MKFKVLWHKSSNLLAMLEYDPEFDTPMLHICDGDAEPFLCYPLKYLNSFGWDVIGEL